MNTKQVLLGLLWAAGQVPLGRVQGAALVVLITRTMTEVENGIRVVPPCTS